MVDAPLMSPELPLLSPPHSPPSPLPPLSLLSHPYSIVYPPSYPLSTRAPSVPCAVNSAQQCKGFACGMCSAARKCPNRPSPSVRVRKTPRFLHWRQHTQSVHLRRAFQKFQDWMDGPSVEQVENWVQLQQRSTWRGACPAYLPVKLVLENPVAYTHHK